MRRSALMVVCLAVFVDMLGFGIILPLLPFQAQRFGGSGLWVGAVLTAYAAAQFIGAPILGALSDRYGRRRLLLLSLTGSAVSLALTGVAQSLWLLLLARMVAGAFGGAIAVGQAYAVDLVDEHDRTRALGLVGASIGMGFVFGPGIGGAIANLGFAGASMVAAAIAAANVVLGLILLPRTPTNSRTVTPVRRSASPFVSLQRALLTPALLPLLLATFAVTLAFTGMEATFALLGARRFDLGPAGLGVIFTGVGIAMAIVQGGLVGRLTDRYGNRTLAVVGALALAVGLAALPFGPRWATYLLLLVLSVGQGLLSPSTAALVARVGGAEVGGAEVGGAEVGGAEVGGAEVGGAEVGGAFGVTQSAAAAARALGPLAAGALFDLSYPSPYLIGGVLCVVGAALFAITAPGRTAADGDATGPVPAPATAGALDAP